MRLTIQTHTEYPQDDYLELPAVDFHKSHKYPGMWAARLIHSPATAESWGSHEERDMVLADIVAAMTKRLLVDERDLEEPVDYTLHVYMLPE